MKLNLLKNAGKVLGFIVDGALKESKYDRSGYLNSSNNCGEDDEVVDAGKTYQNGLDGAQRVLGKTFYR